MTENVTWNFNLSIKDGPAIKLGGVFDTDAYDKISVQIENDGQDKPISVQPNGAGEIDFLCIESDQYSQDSNKDLTYTSGGGSIKITLDRAQVLIGASLINLLENAPTTLTFNNTTDKPAIISILVGRKAV